MSKKSRRESRRNREPREVRYAPPENPYTTGIEFYEDGSKAIRMTDEMTQMMKDQIEFCRTEYPRVWGREFRDDDLLFPDWDAPEPVPMPEWQYIAGLMDHAVQIGVDAPTIYALKKTGILQTPYNETLLEDDKKDRIAAAKLEYERLAALGTPGLLDPPTGNVNDLMSNPPFRERDDDTES